MGESSVTEDHRGARLKVGRALAPVGVMSLLIGVAALGLTWPGWAGASTASPAVADNGVLTEWPLPSPSSWPFDMKWDESGNILWFGEGNPASSPVDRIAQLDPATGVLRQWGDPTSGGSVHGITLDRGHNVWFTEVGAGKVGRLQSNINSITEWSLDPAGAPHGIVVDDVITGSVTVWLGERANNAVSSLDPATGRYIRHVDPNALAEPHSVAVAPDHSIWFVETCGNRVGQLVPGTTDTWRFWQPPTQAFQCGPPNHIGPLFGTFVGSDFWYSEPYNNNIIRVRPSDNSIAVWPAPRPTPGANLITQVSGDPPGNIFFTEMESNQVGRLEPGGSSMPTVVVVAPTVVSGTPLPEATALSSSVIFTPIVTQLTPETHVLTGARSGGFVEWPLPTLPPTPMRIVGASRGEYGGGSLWVSESTANKVARFGVFTSTPVPPTATTTATTTATASATSSATSSPTSSPTPMGTATATATACTSSFTDVPQGSTFYTYIRCLACRGIVSGYADGTFKPNNNVTRGQLSKIVSNAAGFSEQQPNQMFEDVPVGSTFQLYIGRLASRGYISGYACGGPGEPCGPGNLPYFRPNNNATRGQISKIDANAANYNDPPAGQQFEDVSVGSTYYTYTYRLATRGVMGGYPCGGPGEPCNPPGNLPYFRPNNNATRGQTSKIVANTFFPNCQTPAEIRR